MNANAQRSLVNATCRANFISKINFLFFLPLRNALLPLPAFSSYSLFLLLLFCEEEEEKRKAINLSMSAFFVFLFSEDFRFLFFAELPLMLLQGLYCATVKRLFYFIFFINCKLTQRVEYNFVEKLLFRFVLLFVFSTFSTFSYSSLKNIYFNIYKRRR